MNILQINSSARTFENGQGSYSTRLANELVAKLVATHPGAAVTVRDMANKPHPALDSATLQALFTPAETRSIEHHARVGQDDRAIAEAQAADVIVLGVPMYNFGISSQLKNWIDAIARVNVTFKYGATGPEGLLTGKKVYAVFSRGGKYRDTPNDTQTPYLKTFLGFLGMKDITGIFAEGLAMGPESEAAALASARAEIDAAVAATDKATA